MKQKKKATQKQCRQKPGELRTTKLLRTSGGNGWSGSGDTADAASRTHG